MKAWLLSCLLASLGWLAHASDGIDLDRLFAPEQGPTSGVLESRRTGAREAQLADQKNQAVPIGRSGIDAVGASVGNALRQGRERAQALAGPDFERCGTLVSDEIAYMACIKDVDGLKGKGPPRLNAVYAIEGRCDLLAGTDNGGLSSLCKNPNASGCSAIKAPPATVNACVSCGGSNLWLRVYAANRSVVRCW